ncbi:MAG TPA: DUF167 domain-containing protein [Candidatus Pacearchaeota archaeon]|nr:DUF167 domain-containing protein [Candidatus Pacearchaeota archaeon]
MANKTIKIKVKPNSGKQEVIETENSDGYLVNLKSAPENNKANLELIKVLERHFKKKIKIKSGFTSKNKLIEVEE